MLASNVLLRSHSDVVGRGFQSKRRSNFSSTNELNTILVVIFNVSINYVNYRPSMEIIGDNLFQQPFEHPPVHTSQYKPHYYPTFKS